MIGSCFEHVTIESWVSCILYFSRFPQEKQHVKNTTVILPVNDRTEQCNAEFRRALARASRLREKIEALISMVENAQGDIKTANDAEHRVIEEIQKLER
jgi:hypothetical protein